MKKTVLILGITLVLMGMAVFSPQIIEAEDVDFEQLYQEVAELEGQEALEFFESLPEKGLTGNQVLDFFINLPVSEANEQVHEIYQKQGFEMYIDNYPQGEAYNNFKWEKGMGTDITGPYSEQDLRLPFADYVSLEEGTVGDEDKTYKIGVTFHGFNHPWLINWADAAKWEAERHSNVDVKVLDAEFDNSKQASQVDQFISQDMDGILIWPMVEAPTGPPAERAEEAGIPVVSVDRLTGYDGVTSRITGNFPANGAQCGMYLVWKLAEEGSFDANIVMLRKPLGSTADAIRTGHFLKVLSYFPELNILKSYHDADSREKAFENAQTALQAFSDIDVFYGTGSHQALASYEAAKMVDKLESREDGKKMIFLSIDDSHETVTFVQDGKFEVNTPYTPLISDIGMRTLIKIVTGEDMPKDVITPNIPMVTQNGSEIFGLKTQTPEQWLPYCFGPPMN